MRRSTSTWPSLTTREGSRVTWSTCAPSWICGPGATRRRGNRSEVADGFGGQRVVCVAVGLLCPRHPPRSIPTAAPVRAVEPWACTTSGRASRPVSAQRAQCAVRRTGGRPARRGRRAGPGAAHPRARASGVPRRRPRAAGDRLGRRRGLLVRVAEPAGLLHRPLTRTAAPGRRDRAGLEQDRDLVVGEDRHRLLRWCGDLDAVGRGDLQFSLSDKPAAEPVFGPTVLRRATCEVPRLAGVSASVQSATWPNDGSIASGEATATPVRASARSPHDLPKISSSPPVALEQPPLVLTA
jgi:hypothetical protein